MKRFIIQPNRYLKQEATAFYHDMYNKSDSHTDPTNVKGLICILKNDITPQPPQNLTNAINEVIKILKSDLPKIRESLGISNFFVCVVPRAKVNYQNNQLGFKLAVHTAASELNGFTSAVDCIKRVIDTVTTHRYSAGYGGNGRRPYPNITNDTCEINSSIVGKDILLIDDLYTRTINIDEDAINALLSMGARSVYFYSLGNTSAR